MQRSLLAAVQQGRRLSSRRLGVGGARRAGAFLCMTAGGSPRRLETAKPAIANAFTGLAVALLARVIGSIVQGAVA